MFRSWSSAALMFFTACVAAAVFTLFAAAHWGSAFWARTWRVSPRPTGAPPPAAVLLAVRGCDPTLPATLTALARQSHPDYRVRVVVDHPLDPAWDVVRRTVADVDPSGRRFDVELLRERPAHCSLKCAALAQALQETAGVSHIATIDADVQPHADWLITLTAPLGDPRVAVATGNHWFEPPDLGWGSLIRSAWNAGALVVTSLAANPWAGCSAFRRQEMLAAGLAARWLESAVDDGALGRAARAIGKRVAFVPELILVNRESCSLAFCLNYLSRILVWSRLYDRSFGFTVAHAAVNTAAVAAMVGMLLVAAWRGEGRAAAVLVAGGVAYSGLLWAAYRVVRGEVRRVTQAVEGAGRPWNAARCLRWLGLFPAAMVVHGWAVGRAVTARRVRWRAIDYRIENRAVERLNDGPFPHPSEAAGNRRSI